MKPFSEKAIFVWNDQTIGDAVKIASLLLQGKFEAAYLHSVYLTTWRTPSRIALAKALQAAGLRVYASTGIYGDNPTLEGQQAAALVNDYGLDGFICDAESGFDSKSTPDSNAVHLLTTYKSLTSKPVAWCWWARYESNAGAVWHPKAVLSAAMQYADVGMPMAYWSNGDSPEAAVAFLEASWAQWRKVTSKPIVPAGRAYVGDGGTPNRAAVLAYEARARSLGAVGITWWSMEHAIKLPETWQALTDTPKFGEVVSGGNMWKDNAIGLYTKEPTWTNTGFHFVIGHAGESYSEPNTQLKPIEEHAKSMGQIFMVLWDFSVDYYRKNQFPMDESRWPTLDVDWPYIYFTRALAAREYKAVMIRVMNPKNDGGNLEDPNFISFAASQFVARINGWLEKNRPGTPLILVTSNGFISQYSPAMNNWAYKYNSCIEQAAVQPLDAAFPQATDKVKNYISVRPTWEFWFYFNGSISDLFLFNGTPAKLNDFLGITTTPEPPDPPTPPTPTGEVTRAEFEALAAQVKELQVEVNDINARLKTASEALA